MPKLDSIPNTPGRAEIVDLYAKSLSRLKAIVMSVDATDAGKRKAAENILEIQAHIKALKKGNAEWAKEYIPESYKIGWAQDKKLLERYLGNDYTEQFSRMHREAAMTAVEGAAMDLNIIADAMETTYIGYVRRAQLTAARRAIAQEIAGGIIEGASRRTVSNRLLDDLRMRAVDGIVTVGKVTMRADSYAELLARTISRAARTEGTLNRLNEWGMDLVIFNNTGAVDFCREYEDRVFSVSGKSSRYPMLTARPPFHPNCTHILSGFVEEFAEPEEIEYGQGFNRADIGKSAAEMAKKYPQVKDDTRVRTKAA
jgi:hypothetical protein